MKCPHQTKIGLFGTSEVVGCALLDTSLGWSAGIGIEVCKLCQSETASPQPPNPHQTNHSIVTKQFLRLCRLPLMSYKVDEAFVRTWGSTREAIIAKLKPLGIDNLEKVSPCRHATNDIACIHRGKKIDLQDCETCYGRVRVFVFSCVVHEKCTISKEISKYQVCTNCNDRAPTTKRDSISHKT